MSEKVVRLEDILNKKSEKGLADKTQKVKKKGKKENKETLPEGRRISGRVWKNKRDR